MKIQTIVIFFALLVFLGTLTTQHSLQKETNAPRAGEDIVKQQVKYKNPDRSGENVLWNFGQLQPINNKYTLPQSTAMKA